MASSAKISRSAAGRRKIAEYSFESVFKCMKNAATKLALASENTRKVGVRKPFPAVIPGRERMISNIVITANAKNTKA
jgi:hypothetical protein